MNLVSDRLDVKKLILNEGNLNALCNVLMEPYQLKLISHFKTTTQEQSGHNNLSVDQAIELLKKNLRTP